MSNPPNTTQILVIGGGPAGSYAASVLAREGLSVVLVEATQFPRYHIGESMLPSIRPFMRFIDAEEKVSSHGFTFKRGVATKLRQDKKEGYSDFIAMGHDNGAWNVIRSEFDDLLLSHASKCGAAVFQETAIKEIRFDACTPGRPVAASWCKSDDQTGEITFDYLIDCSGRNGIMSTKYLKNRTLNRSLNNFACWGYWEHTERYMPNSNRDNAIWLEALEDESGWVWFIPLHDGSKSIGIVMDKQIMLAKRKAKQPGDNGRQSLQDFYLEELKRVPGVIKLIGKGTLRNTGKTDAVKMANDQSYAATSYAGDHFRIAGDAGAFIDPFFSSGVHLAFTGALSAAITICASIRGSVSESEAALWHDAKVGSAYTRFLLVVLGTYKQMRNQHLPIMSDIDEDNFDRAFDLIRPVIQGTADVGHRLSEDELQKTMDFCQNIFAPTTPEMYASVQARVSPELMSPTGPIMTSADLDRILDPGDIDAKLVLSEINARKAIHPMYSATVNFGVEYHRGLTAVMKHGKLGLVGKKEGGEIVIPSSKC
ncbi:FAD/NAD(P)-binding domain-containing protein [Pholiota conissans]|uniref:FAD/NAD(P)-binding domain-containing protein n=1 Tax=Pholiota conissans TaxID=109636 RepID=A0A9P6D745_9AGAR|nr:FAD/NAD(P)-binding domain-containing protein [Pholiota conissans]